MRAQFDKDNPWLKRPGTTDTSMESYSPQDSREYHKPIFEHSAYIKSLETRPDMKDFQVEQGVENPFEDRGYVLDNEVFPDLPDYVRAVSTSMDYFPRMSEHPAYEESKNTVIPNYQVDLEGKVFPFEDTGLRLEENIFNEEDDDEENFFNLLNEPNDLAFSALLEVLKWEIELTNRFYYIPEEKKKELLDRISEGNASFDQIEKQRLIFEIYVKISEIRQNCGMTSQMERDVIVQGVNNNYFRFNRLCYYRAINKLEQLIDELNDGDLEEEAFLDQIYLYLYYLDVYEKESPAYVKPYASIANEAPETKQHDGTFDKVPSRGTIVVASEQKTDLHPPRRGTIVVTPKRRGTFDPSQKPSTSRSGNSPSGGLESSPRATSRDQTPPEPILRNRQTETVGARRGTYSSPGRGTIGTEPTLDVTQPEGVSTSGTTPPGVTGPRRSNERPMNGAGHAKSKSPRPQTKANATKRKPNRGNQNSSPDITKKLAKKKKS